MREDSAAHPLSSAASDVVPPAPIVDERKLPIRSHPEGGDHTENSTNSTTSTENWPVAPIADAPASQSDAPWRRGYSGPPPLAAPPTQSVSVDGSPGDAVGDGRYDGWRREGGPVSGRVVDPLGVEPAFTAVGEVVVDLPPDPLFADDRAIAADRRSPVTRSGRGVPVVLAALLAVAIGVAVALVRMEPEVRPPGAFVALPERARELWSVDTDDRELMAAGADVVVLDSESSSELSVLDARSGVELWSVGRGPDVPWVAVIDGLVVVRSEDRADIATYDAVTGVPRWSERIDTFSVASAAGLLSEVETGKLELMRWSDGERVAPLFTITAYFNSEQLAVVGDDGWTTFYDRDTFRAVGPAFDIADADARGTRGVVGGHLVRCTSAGSLVLIGTNGSPLPNSAPVSTTACAAAGRIAPPIRVTGDGEIGIAAGPELLAFTVHSDRIDLMWQMAGRINWMGHTERGPIAVITRNVNGRPTDAIIDIESGLDLSAVEGNPYDAVLRPAWNGNLLLDDDASTMRFVDYEGDVRWQLALDGVDRWLPSPTAMVLQNTDESTITAYG